MMYFWSDEQQVMKKVLLFALTCMAICCVKAQTSAPATTVAAPADVLVTKETEHDFGKIPQGKPVYYTFEITNKSPQPLKLDNVVATCGCTTPEWSKDPIAAGGSSRIRVGYNAASEGHFEKYITIQYNGSSTKQIKIKGEVWRAPVGSAPANASIQLLKQQIQ
jgi:hypothetical protein